MKKGIVLLAGLEEVVENRIRLVLDKMELNLISSMDDFLNRLETFNPETVDLAICGPALADLKPTELAQSLRAQIPGKGIFFVSSEKERASDAELLKNGYDQAFFLPFDGIILDRTLRGLQQEISGFETQIHLTIPASDFVADVPLDFEVMVLFPLNQKIVTLSRKGGPIRRSTLDSLAQQGIKDVMINKADQKKFEKYYSEQKTKAGAESQLSRKNRMHASVRKVFHTLLSPGQPTFEEGSALLKKAEEIVGELVENDNVADVFANFFKTAGQDFGDHYEQALRVSSYVTLFSVVLKVGRPEDLAIAGLFHHLGLLFCPENLTHKAWSEMTHEEKSVYSQHPEDGLRLIKEKRIILIPEVQNAILQHHERPDGKGYPKGLPQHKIAHEASLLSMATAFDEMTSMQVGKARLSISEALNHIAESGIAPQEIVIPLKRYLDSLNGKAS